MTVDSLSGLNLHDSEVIEVVVDRADTEADRIIVLLDYIEDYESMEVSRKRLIFHGCYRAVLDMNFGVIAPESIRLGYEVEESDLIDALRSRLGAVGVEVGGRLKHFRMEMNSTASVIDIVAERVELLDETPAPTSGEPGQRENPEA